MTPMEKYIFLFLKKRVFLKEIITKFFFKRICVIQKKTGKKELNHNMPKRTRKSLVENDIKEPTRKCDYCKSTMNYAFCTPGWSCFSCKVKLCEQKMLSKVEKAHLESWSACNVFGKPHFVIQLHIILHLLTCDKTKSIKDMWCELFGPTLYEEQKANFIRLFDFAQEEQNSFRFSPICFSLARMEKNLGLQCMDFWLTLCVVFDVGNYADDYVQMRESK